MSAITAALSQIDGVAAEGDLVPDPVAPLELETAGEPIVLPDGKRIYPPCLHGAPVDELAVALLDMHDPAKSTFLRLIGPPGAGKSQIARAIAYRLWIGRGREVTDRHGAPFYGFVELQPGPSSDEFFFRYDYVPVAGAGGQVKLVDSAFVQAMREGWVVMIDEVNTARDVALLSINATLDGRLSLYLAATGETVVAQPGFAVLLAYNPRSGAPGMYVHSAKSGELAGGRLTLHGVGRNVTWITTGGRAGVAPVTLAQKRLFVRNTRATGVLHIAGQRGGQEFTFRLSSPRYSAVRSTVSYRATPLTKVAVAATAAAAVPRRFGAASLSVLPTSPLGSKLLGSGSLGSGDNGGNDCEVEIFDASGFNQQNVVLRSASNWGTDTWSQWPPATIATDSSAIIESDGGLWRGCHMETVWSDEPSGPEPTVTVDVTWPWGVVTYHQLHSLRSPGVSVRTQRHRGLDHLGAAPPP